MTKKIVLLALFGAWLMGCASSQLSSPLFNVELIKQLQRGVTNKQEVLTLFGNPTTVKVEKGLEQWVYVRDTGRVERPPGPVRTPTHSLTRGDVTLFPEKKGETPGVPGRVTRELTLTFQGETLVEYNIRNL